jgi:hypothetical protein
MTAPNEHSLSVEAILRTLRAALAGEFVGSVTRLLFGVANTALEQSEGSAQWAETEEPNV